MAYNANIPQPGDQLSQSQADILANFQSIMALVDVNHVDFASGDQGKHKWVTLPSQGAIPPSGSGFSPGEIGLYNAVNSVTNKNELYINKTNQATVVQVPSTASILSVNSAPPSNDGGWTYLPSGMLMQFGQNTGDTGLVTVTLNVAGFPVFNALLAVLVCPYSTATTDQNFAVRMGPVLSNTQFQIYISSRTTAGPATGGFQFIAIGY